MPNDAPDAMPAHQPLTLGDLEFDLPSDRIAQRPAERRTDARLMLVPRQRSDAERSGAALDPRDHRVSDLPELLRGDELLVLNDTRVVPARLRARKPTGGAVELLMLTAGPEPGQCTSLARGAKKLRPGTPLHLEAAPSVTLTVAGRGPDGTVVLRLPSGHATPWELCDAHGELPLPPYIARAKGPDAADRQRYQTVFARDAGSVAAPTAGLHFTPELLDALEALGCAITHVTLHVGPGTFAPVRTDDLSAHVMHSERYAISEQAAEALEGARKTGRRILAVGTTVVRTLEASAAAHGVPVPETAATDVFIRPGYRFRAVDQLLTNFHLPGSTLLALVGAFAGLDRVKGAYAHAVARGYRFFSYGDGMLLR